MLKKKEKIAAIIRKAKFNNLPALHFVKTVDTQISNLH